MIKNHIISQNKSNSGSYNNNNNNSNNNDNEYNDFDTPSDDWYTKPIENNINNSISSSSSSSFSSPSSSSLSLNHQNDNDMFNLNKQNLSFSNNYNNIELEDYSNEPPLLEELGIRFDHILSKTKAVIIPIKTLDEHLLDDADLAGPIVYCLLLGGLLLLSGKIHFGYIYGFSLFGCISLYAIINLIDENGLDIWRTASVLGYSMLPIIALAALSIVLDLKGYLGLIISILAIIWSTASSTRIFGSKLQLTEQYWLIAYPIMLLYSCFVLITVF